MQGFEIKNYVVWKRSSLIPTCLFENEPKQSGRPKAPTSLLTMLSQHLRSELHISAELLQQTYHCSRIEPSSR